MYQFLLSLLLLVLTQNSKYDEIYVSFYKIITITVTTDK